MFAFDYCMSRESKPGHVDSVYSNTWLHQKPIHAHNKNWCACVRAGLCLRTHPGMCAWTRAAACGDCLFLVGLGCLEIAWGWGAWAETVVRVCACSSSCGGRLISGGISIIWKSLGEVHHKRCGRGCVRVPLACGGCLVLGGV